MEHMNGSQVELTPPHGHTEARRTSARRSRVVSRVYALALPEWAS